MSSIFDPWRLGGLEIKNRVAMSPMLMYASDDDGLFGDEQLVHYGARILGGVGLITTEVLAVEREGRISTQDLGIWNDEQADGLGRLVQFAHRYDTKVCAQLAHAGRKSKAQDSGLGPSPIAYGDFPVPLELSSSEIERIVGRYAAAAGRAVRVGFDAIELHMCHGYLFHQFLSRAANARIDHYGGSLENRMRFPLEAAAAVRAAIPTGAPLVVRISGDDLAADGITIDETVEFGRRLKAAGADLLVVTTGNIIPGYDGPVFPGYQTPYATKVRQMVDIPVGTVGSIASAELADFLIRTGQADLVYLGRALLDDPFWYLHAAKAAGVHIDLPIPTYSRATGPYERGF